MTGPGPHPLQVAFGWDLTYACNYRCPYCRVWDQPTKIRLSAAEWTAAWERMRKLYGRCYIYISGGEPSSYAELPELIRALTPMHTVDLCTNLSWDVGKVAGLDPKTFHVSATFHPTQVDFEEFLAKARRVKEFLPPRAEGRAVYFVAYPPQMSELERYRRALAESGMVLVPLPLMLDYQIANSNDEKKTIQDVSPNKGAAHKLDYQLKKRGPGGRDCWAGSRYALIRGDGTVDRCSRHKDGQVGNFLDPGFKLWDQARPCHQDWCPYESQWIVEESPITAFLKPPLSKKSG